MKTSRGFFISEKFTKSHAARIIRKKERGRAVEFLPVGDSKLKIVMNEAELKSYKLDSASAPDMDDAATRRSFWQVLELARVEVGFEPSDDKVLIQFYPTKGGGSEIFVTKLGLLPDRSAKTVSRSEKITLLSHRRSYYAFDDLSAIVGASRAIHRMAGNSSPKSDAYIDVSGSFYLVIDEYGKGGEHTEYPMIVEFGKNLTAELSAYISEHCTLIVSENAVEAMAKMNI